MASIVLDIMLPGGAGSALSLLHAIFKACDQMQEGRQACQHVGHRLHGILAELNKLQEANQLLPSNALYEYGAMLRNYLAYLQQCLARPAWSRVLQSKVLMDELKLLHEQVDALLVVLNLAGVSALTDWKNQWELDNVAHQYALVGTTSSVPVGLSLLVNETENISHLPMNYNPYTRTEAPGVGVWRMEPNGVWVPTSAQGATPVAFALAGAQYPAPNPVLVPKPQNLVMVSAAVATNKVRPLDAATVPEQIASEKLVKVSGSRGRSTWLKVGVGIVLVIIVAAAAVFVVLPRISQRSDATPSPTPSASIAQPSPSPESTLAPAPRPTPKPSPRPTPTPTRTPTPTPRTTPPPTTTRTPTSSPTSTPMSTPSSTPSAVGLFTAVTVSSDGYVYVASDRAVYRQTLPLESGLLQLFAGSAAEPGTANGGGSDAQFSGIIGLAAYGYKLYVAERYRYVVRVIDYTWSSSSQYVSIVAGSGTSGDQDGSFGSARFGTITSVGVNASSGDVLVADYSRDKIRKLSISQSTVSTFAVHYVDSTTAIAVRPNGDVYFASQCAIFLISSSGSDESLVAGSTGECRYADASSGYFARFNTISSMALSPSGNALYIADMYNHCIRKMDTESTRLTTVAGVCGRSDSAADGSGSWLSSSRSQEPASSVLFSYPSGLAVDSSALYVIDTAPSVGNGRLRQFGIETLLTVTTLSSGWTNLMALTVSSSDYLYVASDRAVYKMQLVYLEVRITGLIAGSQSESGTTNGYGMDARFTNIVGLAAHGDKVYIAERNSYAVRVLDSYWWNSPVSIIAGSGTSDYVDGSYGSAKFGSITSVGVDADSGDVFVADYSRDRIRKLSMSQSYVSTFAAHYVSDPTAIAVRPSGDLYFASQCAIFLISSSGSYESLVAGSTAECGYADANAGYFARFNTISSIALSPSGNALYVADKDNHCIRKVDTATNQVTTVAGLCAWEGSNDGTVTTSARLYKPRGLAFSSSGDLVFIDGRDDSCNIRILDLTS